MEICSVIESYPAIARARDYAEERLERLRTELQGIVPAEDVVVACGSYARKEASAESDIDYFIISQGEDQSAAAATQLAKIKTTIEQIVPVEPSKDGAFAKVEQHDGMLLNIGGQEDTNAKITRRMLFLLEGDWLFNEQRFKDTRREVLQRYVSDKISDHQIALFLLNDIIRYYRTMMVDYEFKTGEGSEPKPWGIRNIKLVFSRKLMYASGLFSVAKTADLTPERKVERLESLFNMPVADRMIEICGSGRMSNVLNSYNLFLSKLEDAPVRTELKNLKREDREVNQTFRELKNEGHNFTRELMKLFEDTFDPTHPVRRAVLF